MELSAITRGGQTIVEGVPGARLLESSEDIVDVIGGCFEHKARGVLLHAENLTPGFFDLSSGEAGVILQKLRNYRIRLAVVVSPGMRRSSRFGEMALEESKGGDFRIFEGRDKAIAWLVGE